MEKIKEQAYAGLLFFHGELGKSVADGAQKSKLFHVEQFRRFREAGVVAQLYFYFTCMLFIFK